MNFFVCFLFVTTMPFFCYIPYYVSFLCVRDCNKEQSACVLLTLNTPELNKHSQHNTITKLPKTRLVNPPSASGMKLKQRRTTTLKTQKLLLA